MTNITLTCKGVQNQALLNCSKSQRMHLYENHAAWCNLVVKTAPLLQFFVN